MIPRRLHAQILHDLSVHAAVALLGPRQVGKTTLARAIAATAPSIYLDLEDPADRDKLADPVLFLDGHADKLVVIDEIQNAPDLFMMLRGLHRTHAAMVGKPCRPHRLPELAPLDVTEVGRSKTEAAWVRGGFPASLLAARESASLDWCRAFLQTYLSRDIPALGPRIPTETLRRLWTMLAHTQGAPLNAAKLALNLNVSSPTITRYVDLLVELLLVRRLQPFHANVGKRLVKSPKVYVRDSGLLHALLAIPNRDALFGHPIVGASWEGFVIETLIACAPDWSTSFFYRTSDGQEIDLLLELPGGAKWAVEVKRGRSPKVEAGFHRACDDLKPARRFVVYSGTERYAVPQNIEAISLHDLAMELLALGVEHKAKA